MITIKFNKRTTKPQLIILLVGKPDAGKSSTLLTLSRMFEDDALSIEFKKYQARSKDRRICVVNKGHRIGIGMAGDTEKNLEANINFFIEKECDICIMAIREHLLVECTNWAKINKINMSELIKPKGRTYIEQEILPIMCAKVLRCAIRESRTGNIVQSIKDANKLMQSIK